MLSIAVGLLAGLVMGSFATGWYIVPTEVAIATVRTAADEIAEEMVRPNPRRNPSAPCFSQNPAFGPRKDPVPARYNS